MSKPILAACAIVIAMAGSLHAAELSISENGRYLLKDGKPFFFLCDSGWDVFMRASREEADEYLEDRAAKGFNVVMAILIGWRPEADEKNVYGEPPLIDQNPDTPNEKYFAHVDHVVNKANELGMFVAIVPSWSGWMYKNVGPGPHPFDAEKARRFGEFVGRRYKNNDIIWVMGGDRDPTGYEDILRAMAEGLDAGDGERDFLTTFHGIKVTEPFSSGDVYYDRLTSADFFADELWLDFYGAYSGHQLGYPTYKHIARSFRATPVKPVVDLEPCYENHAYIADRSMFWADPSKWDGKTRGTPALVREQAYWSVLAGAAGVTFANNDLWQFHSEARPIGDPLYQGTVPWREAMNKPGSIAMMHLRNLFSSRPWHRLEPDQSLIAAGQQPREAHIQAARAADGSLAMLYLPRGGEVTVSLRHIEGKTLRANWFNPRDGGAEEIKTFDRTDERSFTTPTKGIDGDWVLVIDEASAEFSIPGDVTSAEWPRTNWRRR